MNGEPLKVFNKHKRVDLPKLETPTADCGRISSHFNAAKYRYLGRILTFDFIPLVFVFWFFALTHRCGSVRRVRGSAANKALTRQISSISALDQEQTVSSRPDL